MTKVQRERVTGGDGAEARRARQAAELRANLKKRKAQARARAGQDTAQAEAGLQPGDQDG